MRNKELSFTLPEAKAIKLLESQQQLIMIYDEQGQWTGKTVNKADIVMTRVDTEETRRYSESLPAIDEAKLSPDDIKKRSDLIKSLKPDFSKIAR